VAAAPNPTVPTPINVPVDPEILARDRANYLSALAAASAAADARHQLAMIGVDARVVAFLKEQTEKGSAYAPFDLAGHYREGKGIEVDLTEADRLVRLAVERGNDEAKNWLRDHPPIGSSTGEGNSPSQRGER
jgi:TPR repeat protein